MADLPTRIAGVELRCSDVEASADFYRRVVGLEPEEVGMELMTRFGDDAIFCGFDGYHHHVGANAWFSRGAGPEPSEGPGLAMVAIDAAGVDLRTPDGVLIQRAG